jgi:predicted RecB family nuclease
VIRLCEGILLAASLKLIRIGGVRIDYLGHAQPVYFDIEGLPEQEFYYLIGALVVQDGKETHHVFWADSPAEQQSIFLRFSRLVADLAPCKLFHFGRYDSDAIKAMRSGLDEDAGRQMDTVLGEATNVLTVIHSHVYFPGSRSRQYT